MNKLISRVILEFNHKIQSGITRNLQWEEHNRFPLEFKQFKWNTVLPQRTKMLRCQKIMFSKFQLQYLSLLLLLSHSCFQTISAIYHTYVHLYIKKQCCWLSVFNDLQQRNVYSVNTKEFTCNHDKYSNSM